MLEKNFMPYAMSVIVSRAIPEIDGFKPAHRKLLYTMYKMGLLGERRIKSADIVGQTMRLNPHGDGPIYETMVRLARGAEALLHPFIDSKGNFGKHYSRDMAYAASRYTEAKLDPICRELFANLDKDVVDMVDNYNSTMLEPTLLPTTFPNALVTPNTGIAVGMSCSVCSFNLKEVVETTINFLQNPKADIAKTLIAPDFSTGGEIIIKPGELEGIYETGRGSFKIRAKYRFDKKNSIIEVYEIPYTTTIEAVIDKIVSLIKAAKLRDINDVRDETDLGGLKIAIEIKKSADADTVMQRLFSLTTLMDSFSCNFNFLIDGKPRVMGVREILAQWTRFRITTLTRQLQYDIKHKSDKLHLLGGLSKILLDIDLAIKIIRETKKENEVIRNLCAAFNITEEQAEYVAEIKLRHLNEEHLISRVNEQKTLEKEIGELKNTLSSEGSIKKMIIAQLKEIAKKYAKPRKTDVVPYSETPPVAEETFIDDYNVKLFLTKESYFKKITLVSLRSSGEQYVKDGDGIVQELEATNRDEVLLFTSEQNVYKVKINDIPESKASSLGEYLENFLEMLPGEKCVHMVVAKDYTGYMIFAFENGKMTKVKLSEYATKTNRRKLINAYSGKSPLVAMLHIADDTDLYLQRGFDKALVVNSAKLPLTGTKASGGVSVFTLKKGSKLAKMRLADECDHKDYFRTEKIPSTGHFLQKQIELS